MNAVVSELHLKMPPEFAGAVHLTENELQQHILLMIDLAKLDQLNLLNELVPAGVFIPEAVNRELWKKARFEEAECLFISITAVTTVLLMTRASF